MGLLSDREHTRMVELETGWQPSTKLNVIAGELDFTVVDPLPDDVTRDQIEEYCYTLRDMYGEYVEELVGETTLSQREAQAWVLRNYVYEGHQRLSYEAVGLYIWAIGRATEGDPLSRTIVSKYYRRAREKTQRAEETLKRRGAPPYPDDVYDEPALLWVEGDVGERLQRHAGPDETYSDLVERLLDEATARISVESFVETYRDQRDSAYVAVETVQRDWDRRLEMVVHAPGEGDTPNPVAAADHLSVADHHVEFEVTERETPRRERSHLVVFDAVSDTEAGPDGAGRPARGTVAVEEGTERLRRALETVELDLPGLVELARETGAVGLAVADQPAGAGAHLYPISPEGGGSASGPDVAERFEPVERVALDDRTLRVGQVTPVSAAEYGDIDEVTLLWAGDDAPTGPLSLPEDPVDRRERLPTTVLHTA